MYLKRPLVLIITIFIVILDQFSKQIIHSSSDYLKFDYLNNLVEINVVKNTGAAFSFLSDYTFLLSFISLIVAIILTIIIARRPYFNFNRGMGLSLLLAGTIGNGLDRWRLGYVIDFIQIVPFNFPVFNIADISINIAIIFIIFDNIKPPDKSKDIMPRSIFRNQRN